MPRAPRDPTGRQEGEPPYLDAFPKTESRPRRRARWEPSEPTTEGEVNMSLKDDGVFAAALIGAAVNDLCGIPMSVA